MSTERATPGIEQPRAELAVLRHVNRESVLLLEAGRALLMQIAHPHVALGVAEHSTFRADRVGRLLRTLRPMYAMAFGTDVEALEAARRLALRHAAVMGTNYRADDPELQLWVYATLIDSALDAYGRFVRPLTPALEEAYYDDAIRVGGVMGMPRSLFPPGIEAFHAYVDEVTAALEVTDLARELASEVLAPPSMMLAPAFLVLRQLTAGLLPPRLRAEFRLDWGRGRESALEWSGSFSRSVWPRLPTRVRTVPAVLMPPSTRGR